MVASVVYASPTSSPGAAARGASCTVQLGASMDGLELTRHEGAGDGELRARVDRKVSRRLLPVLFAAALMCYIDRTNLSFAALDMNRDLGLSKTQYGIGAGVFFFSYAGFGVPSSLLVKRLGARVGLPLILVLWGLASGAMTFIRGSADFYVLRLVVGATEAGFFPSVVYYLTLWVSEEDMGFTYTAVMTATVASGIVGGPLAGAIMTYFDGLLGLASWRWLFMVEAVPTVLLGVFMLFYLDATPRQARFLTAEEKDFLVSRQSYQESRRRSSHASRGILDVLRLQWLWSLIGIWLLYSCGYYGIIFWLPLLIDSLGERSTLFVGLLSTIPYIFAGASMLLVARSSDRTRERRIHLAAPALVSAVGFFGAAAIHAAFGNVLVPLLVCLSVAAAGVWAMFGPYWAIPTSMLTGDMAQAGFALINSFGVIGGFVGPCVEGVVTEKTGNYDAALVFFSVLMAISGGLALCLRPDVGSNPKYSDTVVAPLKNGVPKGGYSRIGERASNQL